MDPQRLRPFVTAIKEDSEDPFAWLQLGDAAKIIGDWKIATWTYSAALLLLPDDEVALRKFTESRQKLIESSHCDSGFMYEIFKLPRHTSLILIVGIMNTEVEAFEMAFKSQIKSGFKNFIIDFKGSSNITGLGPSLLKKFHKEVIEVNGFIGLVSLNQDIKEVKVLKKIEIPDFSDVQEVFLTHLSASR